MSHIEQHCPICQKSIKPSARYPHYICGDCCERAIDQQGRAIEFYNTNWNGSGCQAHDKQTQQPLEHHGVACWIDGQHCYAQEAYFGGIVIRLIQDTNTKRHYALDHDIPYTLAYLHTAPVPECYSETDWYNADD
ncbi:MAG: hypothetical protein VXW65_09275 [Pseudomonadota bacterium]|nr:hypothetical protein [Pseudomonadota bacterium]